MTQLHDARTATVPQLRDLAEVANSAHDLVVQATCVALEHAQRAGAALCAAKAEVPHGEWLTWLEEHFHASAGTAWVYMNVATYPHMIADARTLKEARTLLVGRTSPDRGQLPVELEGHALALREDGMSIDRIADILGVGRSTVYRWIDPAAKRRHYEYTKAQKAKRRAAEKALREQERQRAIKRAVRKAGAATAEAWVMAERMQDVLAQAQRESNDPESRRALSEAGEHYRKMRDEIVRALGVSA